MIQPQIRVYFYDYLHDPGEKEGQYYTLDEALREDFVSAEGTNLVPTDKCSIIEWSYDGGIIWRRENMQDHEAVAWALMMGLELRESRPGAGLPYKRLFLREYPVGIEWKGLGYQDEAIFTSLAIALFDGEVKDG